MARLHTVTRWLAAGLGLAAGAYATYVGVTWARYGRVREPADPSERDALLDRFMPRYDIVERHRIAVAAPARVTVAAAREMNVRQSALARAIFLARERLLGAGRDERRLPTGLLDQVLSLGWRVLAEEPDREIVVGAVTKPWEAEVTFRGLSPEAFDAFNEPDFVKIVWTLRADAIDDSHSIFRTETRAVATDAGAATKFRRYWAFLSPGICLIRQATLGPLKAEAERRARLERA